MQDAFEDLPGISGASDSLVVAALASAFADEVQSALDGDAALVPDGYSLEDLEQFESQPRRVEETLKARTLQGFLDYFEKFNTPNTAVFAHPTTGVVEAVFDYHHPDPDGPYSGPDPQWGDHTISYDPRMSRQWKTWTRASGDMMDQLDFAEFIEEHAEDVVNPPSAELLELARDFEAKKDVTFKKANRQQSGDVQLQYEEDTSVTGDVEVPEKFTLGLPILDGGDRWEVKARFRYRLRNGNLKMGFKILQPDEIKEQAAGEVIDSVEETAEDLGVPVFYARR